MNPDRAASLLASGLKPAQVASVLGVTPARISQLLSSEEFKLLLSSKEAEIQKTDVEEQAISTKYNAAEHLLVEQVMTLAPTAEMRDIVGALRVIAERQEKMKTRTSVQAPSQSQHLTVVSVNLPSHALVSPKVIMNSAREVTSIGDRALAPMSSSGVINMFQAKKGVSHEHLPSNPSTEESPVEALPSSSSESFPHFLEEVEEVEEESFLSFSRAYSKA